MSTSRSITTSFNLYANNYANAYANTYFNYLPKEIIDTIHEYNVDHRPAYNKVLEELLERRTECCNCGEHIPDDKQTKQTFYRYYKQYFVCSSYCMWETNYDARRIVRLSNDINNRSTRHKYK
jgi:hypothetical protein